MSALQHINSVIIPAAFSLLPAKMDSIPARAMVLTPGLQESKFIHRRQIGGPAHGLWQFERMGGVRGVLKHRATREIIEAILKSMAYDNTTQTSYEAIVHNDILACVYARLLLWTSPRALPTRDDPEAGWKIYLEDCWRPGKPHRSTWNAHYEKAWSTVEGD